MNIPARIRRHANFGTPTVLLVKFGIDLIEELLENEAAQTVLLTQKSQSEAPRLLTG